MHITWQPKTIKLDFLTHSVFSETGQVHRLYCFVMNHFPLKKI